MTDDDAGEKRESEAVSGGDVAEEDFSGAVVQDGEVVKDGETIARLSADAVPEDLDDPGSTTCYWLVEYWVQTGEIIRVTLLGCTADGGGGDNCTEDQKAIAEEYRLFGISGDWPCDKFKEVLLDDKTGTHGHEKGYLSPAYLSGRGMVTTWMIVNKGITVRLNSEWRCPEGNQDVKGVPGSQHVRGTAGDFHADGFDRAMWDDFNQAAMFANASEWSDYGSDKNKWNYTSHIHIDWR